MYVHEAKKLHLLLVTQVFRIVQDEAAGALFHADLQPSVETEGSGVPPAIAGFAIMTVRTRDIGASNALNMMPHDIFHQ